jgi:hypothetical protein
MSENIVAESVPHVNHVTGPALLPANLGVLAELTAREGHARFGATTAIQLHLTGHGTYTASATNGRVAGIVTGACEDGANYPAIPALASAPNGEHEALIPAGEWKAAFKAVPRGRKASRPVLTNVAVVLGKDVTTLASTDLDTTSVRQPRNVDGRFPLLSSCYPEGPPAATVTVDPAYLIEVLKAAAAIAGPEGRVTLEVRDYKTIIVVKAENKEEEQQFHGVVVPVIVKK